MLIQARTRWPNVKPALVPLPGPETVTLYILNELYLRIKRNIYEMYFERQTSLTSA